MHYQWANIKKNSMKCVAFIYYDNIPKIALETAKMLKWSK